MRRAEDLARTLPKLVDLHLKSGLLAPAGGQAGQYGPIGRMMEHIVCLYCCIPLLFVPVQCSSALSCEHSHMSSFTYCSIRKHAYVKCKSILGSSTEKSEHAC